MASKLNSGKIILNRVQCHKRCGYLVAWS